MDQAFRHLNAVAAGTDLTEAGADRDQAVTVLERLTRRRRRRQTKAHTRVQRVIAGKAAEPLQRRGHRRAETVGQRHQLLTRTARAPAHEQARPPRRRNQLAGFGDQLGRRRHRRRQAGPFEQPAGLTAHHQHVDRQFHVDRAGASAHRLGIRAIDRGHDVTLRFDPPTRLGEGSDQCLLIDIVQLIPAPAGAVYAAGQHQHRHTVEIGLGDAAGRVRQARAGHHQQRADTIRRAADRVRHERGPAFVRDQHRHDRRGRCEFIEQLGRMHARNSEDVSDANLLQRESRQPGTGALHVCP